MSKEVATISPPYARLIQPELPNSVFAASSYIRLGSYVPDETGLPTSLKTTTSKVDPKDVSARDEADEARLNKKKDPGKEFSATSQSEKKFTTVVTKTVESKNDGVLLYSSADLNENIVGAALQKYGKGHAVQVNGADAKYDVTAGKLDISALNGVFIKAGKLSESYDVVQPANIELLAGGYIKQTAYGPLDETTYGVTRKVFHGEAYDTFHGFKESKFRGESRTYNMAATMTIALSSELTIRMSTRLQMTFAIDLSIYIGVEGKINIAGLFAVTAPYKLDTIVGFDNKVVIGSASKWVVGSDFKSVMGSDSKCVMGNDFKMVSMVDGKIVHNATSIMSYKFESNVTTTKIEASKNEACINELRQGTISTSMKALMACL